MYLLTEFLENSAKEYSYKIAIVDEDGSWSYLQIYQWACQIANYIVSKEIFQKQIIVFTNKSAQTIAAFWGILLSGNTYVPIDSKMPLKRLEIIIKILEPKLILYQNDNQEQMERLNYSGNSYNIANIEKENEDAKVNLVDIHQKVISEDIAYILYTSGSTGIPKGVCISHKSVIHFMHWISHTFEFSEEERIGNQSPLHFSMSVFDMYLCFMKGVTLYLIPERLFSKPNHLLKYLDDNKITMIYWVPTALISIAYSGAMRQVVPSCLNKIFFSGEVMPVRQLNIWRKYFSSALFVNLYGSTEVTDVCSYYILDREFSNDEVIPIGKPCSDFEFLILNEQNQKVKQGEIGELCVRGTQLSSGYFKNMDKTREVFVQNPLNPDFIDIIYKTGDLVSYDKIGNLVYLARKDFQIKHLGCRIELGEIEMIVYSLYEKIQCCCVYDEKKRKIIMFYSGSYVANDLIGKLKEMLPDYMLPNKIIQLDELPYNSNTKIDRQKLKLIIDSRQGKKK